MDNQKVVISSPLTEEEFWIILAKCKVNSNVQSEKLAKVLFNLEVQTLYEFIEYFRNFHMIISKGTSV